VFHDHGSVQTTPDIELSCESQESGCQHRNKVIFDLVGHGFVICPLVPVVPDIEFEGFQFHTLCIGHILQLQCGKIRLPGDWTQASKLRNVYAHCIIMFRIGVWKYFEVGASLHGHLVCLVVIFNPDFIET